MRIEVMALAAVLSTAPLDARAADLVVWWEQGTTARRTRRSRETIAAFEQDSGKNVELVFHPRQSCRAGSRRSRRASRLTLAFGS